MKISTHVTIDSETLKQARERYLNVSGILEGALRSKLGKITLDIDKSDVCEFCNKEMRRATRDKMDGLMWLDNYQQWICPKCLKEKTREVSRGKAFK